MIRMQTILLMETSLQIRMKAIVSIHVKIVCEDESQPSFREKKILSGCAQSDICEMNNIFAILFGSAGQ